ncbi:MAG TPA: protein kinase [Rudaea sp.]|jgi:serine/threonine-protein kinase|uniref:serine/threonine-protein kinase n=1 Tax=Rudaea sp. TaxID=2136325 RepID=UPI002F93F5C7
MKQQLGHYDIVAELGRGGMGVVYKGYEGSLNRYVAIKVLADSLADDAAVKERFLREARSMAVLNDPHIIQIYFIGDDAGQTYFVMEFVDGESLGSVLKREGLLHPDQAARIVYQTALGLATAHDRGVIHRDIKPGNIMIGSRGNVKIADFGIALSTQDFSKKLTSTGEFVGTPGYLSPEVCLGKPVDQRSDIFSLGIVLFEMLAGRMPFTDESPLGLMLEVVKAEIPDVCTLNHEVDPELSRILARMITKDPHDRYQSCHELVADLARHPLLAAGGTLKLQTQPSAAAATMIGMKTPISGQGTLPSTTPTPRAQSVPAVASRAQPLYTPAAEASPAAHESVLQRQTPPAKRSSAVPLAIAALLVLGLGGGAWAYRDQIPFLQQWLPSAEVAAAQPLATTPVPATTASAATSDATGNAATTSATAQTVVPAPTPATPTAAAAPPAPPVAEPAAAAANVASNTASLTTSTSPPASAAPTGASAPATALTASATPPTAHDTAAGPAPRASEVEPLKGLAAAQAAKAATPGPQVARIETPPPATAPPRPHVPTIAVLFGGDVAVSEPAGHAIERALAHHGYRLLDAEMMPRAERFIGGQRPNIAGLLEMLANGGRVDAVVVVHARPVGAQNISYYGQNDTMNTAQLNVNVYAVHGQHKLGSGWSENVNFTALSAKDQAEEAVHEIAPQVESILVEYKPGRNRG